MKNVFLKTFVPEHLFEQSYIVEVCNFIEKDSSTQVISCVFCKFSKNM